jgi:hypothetical protein
MNFTCKHLNAPTALIYHLGPSGDWGGEGEGSCSVVTSRGISRNYSPLVSFPGTESYIVRTKIKHSKVDILLRQEIDTPRESDFTSGKPLITRGRPVLPHALFVRLQSNVRDADTILQNTVGFGTENAQHW